MTIVTVSEVSGEVFASLTSSSLKNGAFELTTGVGVTAPPPPGVGVGVGVGVRVGVGVGVGVGGPLLSRPKKWMVLDSWMGMLWVTPCSLVASTWTAPGPPA